jgi:hypothetical protein
LTSVGEARWLWIVGLKAMFPNLTLATTSTGQPGRSVPSSTDHAWILRTGPGFAASKKMVLAAASMTGVPVIPIVGMPPQPN